MNDPKSALESVTTSIMWTAGELRRWARGESAKMNTVEVLRSPDDPSKLLDEIERFAGIARELLVEIRGKSV